MVCPNCGNDICKGLDRCSKCGTPLNPLRPIIDPEEGAEHFARFLLKVGKSHSKSWVVLLGRVLVALLLLVPVATAVLSRREAGLSGPDFVMAFVMLAVAGGFLGSRWCK